jgi:malonyl-CoA/methylmalonyl-CoA synthetase
VFSEYWDVPRDARGVSRRWFRTGDVAVVEDGAYRLLGRTSVDIIKTGGYKVSALEIEDAVREHPAVADCADRRRARRGWGQRVLGLGRAAAGRALTLDELRASFASASPPTNSRATCTS